MGIKPPMSTPTKSPSISRTNHHQNPNNSMDISSSSSASEFNKSRYEAYNRLQAAAVAFGEKLHIPEIIVIGGQSDGKSSLLEALLGFRFNVREVEMGTRRPLILQMVHDDSAVEPRCRFQEEDSEEYGNPVSSASKIADIIKTRTEALLNKTKTTVSSKPIVMRAEYAHSPNLTIIDTPGFILKAKKGEPENTPEEILSMVKSLASHPHRLLLFLQQSSVEWCSSLWLDTIREIDPTLKRTIVVVSKFDNRLKEFTDRWEVDRYLGTSGYLGDNVHPYFVALPKDRGIVSNEDFRRQICKVDSDVLRHLREGVDGGFDEEKFGKFIGFGRLKEYLEAELQKRYRDSVPATLTLLEQRCDEVTTYLARAESKIRATSDVAYLRRSAMMHAASISTHVGALIDGAADPCAQQWGKTTKEEQLESGIGSWPGVSAEIKPPNSTLKLYGGAAFERVMHEFRCATYSIECPPVSIEKVANVLLANAGHGGGGSTIYRLNQAQGSQVSLELSDGKTPDQDEVTGVDQENIPPERNAQQTTPEQNTAAKDVQLTVPETPSPDQPRDNGKKKEHGNDNQPRGKMRHAKKAVNTRNMDHRRLQNAGDNLFVNSDIGSRSGSAYSEVFATATQYFCRIREVLIERSVPSALNAGFLTPCTEKLVVALGIDLFAVNDEKFMDMFVAPGAVDALQDERQSLCKRQKTLQSCLNEFKNIARSL
ncbi:dynamin-related protein 5A-like isoform X2 [Papaver somniferum]|uniref:dynamin-related protein 5A-like isoform X2 n=1 Tax=Papaver somniferum TaxID=3469 RepID=UPI000E704414|nr:dynamin-related protein 5A-like isoform X2 [Papaver somniferum]